MAGTSPAMTNIFPDACPKREDYSPSTIFATMSRWISDEPPKIV
jgi:hypothetical protein